MYRSTYDAINDSVPDQPLLKLKKYMSDENGEVQEVDCNEEVTIVDDTPKKVRWVFCYKFNLFLRQYSREKNKLVVFCF